MFSFTTSNCCLDWYRLYWPCCCLRELVGGSWTKTPHYLVCRIEVLFICSTGIFSDRETLELQAASASFDEFLTRLDLVCLQHFLCMWNCSSCIYCEYRKCHILTETSFIFILEECHTLFPCVICHTFPSIFQWYYHT